MTDDHAAFSRHSPHSAKVHYACDTVISVSIPEWLADALIVAASKSGCSKSAMAADFLCLGITGMNLMEHEGKYRRSIVAAEVAKHSQNYSSVEAVK